MLPGGFEPPIPYENSVLSAARMPIPPREHVFIFMPFHAFVKTVYWMDMFRRFAIIFFLSSVVFTFSVHAASSVVINEIQTGGADADDEFIELWNESDAPIALDDWSLQYKTATGTTINKRNFEKGATIPAQGYYLVATKVYTGSATADLVQSSVSLAKSGGNLYLVRNQEVVTNKDDPNIVDRVAWGTGDSAEGSAVGAPDSGQSIARDGGSDTNNNAKDFSIQTTPTPANTKTITATGSASTSSEPQTPAPASATPSAPSKKESVKEEKGTLSITEILPNPVGSDEREFIELQNTGTAPLPLTGWRITNFLEQEYRFATGTLAPKEYRALWREKSILALQNDREEIRLFAPDKDRATEIIKYTDAPDGLSLIRDANDDLVWTTTPTPGETNLLVEKRQVPHVILHAPKEGNVGELLNFDASDSFAIQSSALTFHWDFGDELGKGEEAQTTYIYLKPGTFTIAVTVIDAEGMTTIATQKIKISGEDLLAPPVITKNHAPLLTGEGGVRVAKTISQNSNTLTVINPLNDKKPLVSGTIRGVVTVPPGVLAKTYMYVACETPCANEGVKVRMTKADWPALQKGDVVIISGKASTANNEPSFLVKKEGVRVAGARKQITPEPLPSFRDIDDALLRHFVIATGEITDKKSGLLYLDDGAGELPVAAKASPLIAEGDKISIAGILTKTEKGYVLKASEPATVINAQPKVAKTPTQIVRDKNSERTKYLVTTLAALLALGAKPVITFVQKRRKKNTAIV